ncbi:hypothetical protein X777_16266 [Ooceraea biroi]|uniref:Uncharacterized protein n=1 Tax=Ooceraea biroi TaxID=2015173 RepID=A0A026VUE7_OOCBI|nr:hypothetical protein X777_16266 [Ooceraea biroi]
MRVPRAPCGRSRGLGKFSAQVLMSSMTHMAKGGVDHPEEITRRSLEGVPAKRRHDRGTF